MRRTVPVIGFILGLLAIVTACSSDGGNDTSGATGSGGALGSGGVSGGGATGSTTCNNGVIDPGEACDGVNLGSENCSTATMGAKPSGQLKCNAACGLDVTSCTAAGPVGGGAGGATMMMGAGGMPAGNAGSTGAAGTPATGGTTAAGGATGSGGGTASSGETGRMVGMTAAMNDVRHQVQTTTPLPDLTWSSSIAAVAQAYADKLAANGCNMVHSQNPSYGENLAWFGGGPGSAASTVSMWAGEKACYTYGAFMAGDACSAACQGACGHYTQIVWRNTTQVGCGVASCGGSEIWVCNFAPPGNYVGQTPY